MQTIQLPSDVESLSAQDVLRFCLDTFPGNVSLACSFQKEETVLLDMLFELDPKARVFAIDTHHLFPETYELWREMEQSARERLLVITENYPQLRSNENFLRLQDELAGTENRIAVERRKYNETLEHYNAQIQRFPDNIVASMSGFTRNDAYFKTEPGARQAPKVQF